MQVDSWEMRALDRRTSRCKGCEAGTCWRLWREQRSLHGQVRSEQGGKSREAESETRGTITKGLAGQDGDSEWDCCCCCSATKPCPILWDPRTVIHQVLPSFTVSSSLLKLMSVESVMPSNHLILCYRLLLSPSIFPSIRVFSK